MLSLALFLICDGLKLLKKTTGNESEERKKNEEKRVEQNFSYKKGRKRSKDKQRDRFNVAQLRFSNALQLLPAPDLAWTEYSAIQFLNTNPLFTTTKGR